jgi:YVTN family beta-propeller protein
VYFIDIATLTVIHQVQVAGVIVHLALHPTQPLLYASPQGSSTIFEINTTTREQRPLATAATAPQAIVVSLDGSELYVANEGGTVDVVTIATGTSSGSIALGCGGYGMAGTPDGAQLYVSCSLDGMAKIVDLVTRTVIGTLSTGGTPRRVAVSRDGATVAIANEGGWVDFIQ